MKHLSSLLGGKDKELLIRFLSGQTLAEIGREWGVSRQAVDQRYSRIIQKLKEIA